MAKLVPFVITHDMAKFTLAQLADAGIEVGETFDVRAVNMEESPLESEDAWAWAAQLYGDCVPDAVPFVITVDANKCAEVKEICRRVLGKLETDESLWP